VWAPRTKPDPATYPNGYPVIVNLHGGAYMQLSSKFDGTPFAKKDTGE
jgi:carboxylesterase type B